MLRKSKTEAISKEVRDKLYLWFGPEQSFGKQLKMLKYKYDPKEIAKFNDYAKSILILSFAGIITDKQKKQMQQKVYNKIKSHVEKKNKIKIK